MNRKSINEARDRFRALMEIPGTKEQQFQKLFSEFPFILSETLPVRLSQSDIIPLGRPGLSEPDFIFFPNNRNPITSYGIIELKRPKTKILRMPRKQVLCLSSDTSTALSQAQKYAIEMKAEIINSETELLVMGSELYLFLIVGLSKELMESVSTDILRAQYDKLLPPNCRLIPYDTLLKQFELKFPPPIHVLMLKNQDALFAKSLFDKKVHIVQVEDKNITLGNITSLRWAEENKIPIAVVSLALVHPTKGVFINKKFSDVAYYPTHFDISLREVTLPHESFEITSIRGLLEEFNIRFYEDKLLKVGVSNRGHSAGPIYIAKTEQIPQFFGYNALSSEGAYYNQLELKQLLADHRLFDPIGFTEIKKCYDYI